MGRFFNTILGLALSWCSHIPLYAQEEHATLFSVLDPAHSNITFDNVLSDNKEANIMIYSNFYGGGGVGIGDINNDGLPDVFFAGNQVGDRLYLNKGDLVFEDITESAGIEDNGGWSSGVVFGDINKDGFQDIYVTRELYDDLPELRRNKLYINNGDNTFSERAAEYGVDNDHRTRHATFFDYNKDGNLDLFLLNQPPNPGNYSPFANTELLLEEFTMRLYKNTGDAFVDVTKEAGLYRTGFPNSITTSDLDGDGWTDIFIANDFWVEDWIFFNNGDGTFTEKIHEKARHISFSSMGVDAADINNDGRLDLAVLDMVAEDNPRRKANMSGPRSGSFWKVVGEGGHYQYMYNMLHLNLGDGYLSDVAHLAKVGATDWSWSILLADFDNNGWKDIFICNGLMRDIRNYDAASKFALLVGSKINAYLANNPNPENISLWDIVDLQEVLEVSPMEKLSNYFYKNEGNLTFTKKSEEWGLGLKTFSNGAAYADLDNDGDLDLVVNNINDTASIFINHAAGQPDHHWLRILPVADADHITADGVKVWIESESGEQFFEITRTRGMYSTSEMVAHFGLGTTEKVDRIRIRWPDGKEEELRNKKADRLITVKYSDATEMPLLHPNTSNPIFIDLTDTTTVVYKHVENEFDDYRTQILLPHKMSSFGPVVTPADVNGDGLDDFYIGGSASKPGSIFLQNMNGRFQEKASPAFTKDKLPEDLGSAFFDYDNDGDMDLYVVSGGNEFFPGSRSYQDRLYVNDGSGAFEKAGEALPELKFSGSKVRPCDYDRDGDMDLFVAGRHIPWDYPLPATSAILRNDSGTYKDVTEEVAGELVNIGMVNDALWFDYNKDEWQDLVLVGEWMPVTIFTFDGTRFTKIQGLGELERLKGWWFSVEAADMDLDGDDDLIVGNMGLNYFYQPTQAQPLEGYYYDFDNNGKKDIVLTYYNFGKRYPIRHLKSMIEQIPSLRDKFASYDIYSESEVEEVLGIESINAAYHVEATTFSSYYLENRGDGHFDVRPLPRLAQLSSVNDIVIDDYNMDSHPDVLLAGNLYDVEAETVRNDAGYGLVLLGDGQGNFEVVDRNESGLFLPYDVKSLARIRHTTGKMLLAGCNNDTLRVIRMQPVQFAPSK